MGCAVVIRVKFTKSGPSLADSIGSVSQALNRRMHGALTASVLDWRRTVIRSTWFHPYPSPGNFIVARWYAVGRGLYVFEYGWVNYSGDQGRAEYRMGLREADFVPRFFDRIDRMIQPALMGRD